MSEKIRFGRRRFLKKSGACVLGLVFSGFTGSSCAPQKTEVSVPETIQASETVTPQQELPETPTPVSTSTPSPTDTFVPTNTLAPTETLSPEEALWQLAEDEAKDVGEGTLPYIWNEETKTIKYKENGQIIEKVLPISPADVYENKNLETILSEPWLIDEMTISGHSTGSKTFDFQYLPALYDGQMKKIGELVKLKTERNVQGWTVKIKLFIPSLKNSRIGILKPAWVQFYHFYLAFNPIEVKYRWISSSSAGDTDRHGDMTQDKLEALSQLNEDDFLLIPNMFGENYYWQTLDGKDPLTDEEREDVIKNPIVPWGKPINGYTMTSEIDVKNLLANPGSIKETIFIASALWLAPGKEYQEENKDEGKND